MRLIRVLFLSMVFAGCGDKDSDDGDDTAHPDVDADGFDTREDCNDDEPTIFPGAPEACNGVDDDCDGAVDDDAWQPVYADQDLDGHGAPGASRGDCTLEPGESDVGDDCDDADAARFPGADEVCDGLDNDCDGRIDVDPIDGVTLYTDGDRDGFGDDATARAACSVSAGAATQGGDCDDADSASFPGGEERCDGADNDCDGAIDGADATDALSWLPDADDDGWGIDATPLLSCSAPSGYSADNGGIFDCDDDDPMINPAALEVCEDGLDNDCDGGPGSCRLTGATSASAARSAAFSGDADDERLGAQLCAGRGDEGADGYDDLAFGAPGANNRRGAAYAQRGEAAAAWGEQRASQSDVVIAGLDAGDELGAALAWAGDFTGDGRDDLLIGAPGADDGGSASGVALLFAAPLSSGDADDARWALYGAASDEVGGALAGAGDLDGDGYADLLIGAASWSNDKGRVYVVHGPAGSGDADIETVAVALSGTARGEGQSLRVAGGGDGDGDGLADALIGAPYGSWSGTSAGVIWLMAGPLSVDATFSTGLALYGAVSGDEAGAALDWLGDVDGDGYDDLIAGAPGTSGGGEAYLVLGPLVSDAALSGAAATFVGESSGARTGAAVGRAGDVDADGYADWLVGAPSSDAGAAALGYGGPGLSSGVFSLLPLVLAGGATGDALGSGVGQVGDLDGDGYADFGVSAPYRDVSADTDAGTLYLLLGQGW